MIVINKKRIKIILGCLFISLFAFSMQIAKPQNGEKGENVIETAATPISGKTIVVDARASESQMSEKNC